MGDPQSVPRPALPYQPWKVQPYTQNLKVFRFGDSGNLCQSATLSEFSKVEYFYDSLLPQESTYIKGAVTRGSAAVTTKIYGSGHHGHSQSEAFSTHPPVDTTLYLRVVCDPANGRLFLARGYHIYQHDIFRPVNLRHILPNS